MIDVSHIRRKLSREKILHIRSKLSREEILQRLAMQTDPLQDCREQDKTRFLCKIDGDRFVLAKFNPKPHFPYRGVFLDETLLW